MGSFVVRSLLVGLLVAIGTVMLLWWGAPRLIEGYLAASLEGGGWELRSFELPHQAGFPFRIDKLALASETTSIEAAGIEFEPLSPGDEFLVRIQDLRIDNEPSAGAGVDMTWRQAIESIRTALPPIAARGEVEHLTLCVGECMTGRVQWRRDEERLEVSMGIDDVVGDAVEALAVLGATTADVAIAGRGQHQYLLDGHLSLDPDAGSMDVHASVHADASARPFILTGQEEPEYRIEARKATATLDAQLPIDARMSLDASRRQLQGTAHATATAGWVIHAGELTVTAADEDLNFTLDYAPSEQRLILHWPVRAAVGSAAGHAGTLHIGALSTCSLPGGNPDCRLVNLDFETAMDTKGRPSIHADHAEISATATEVRAGTDSARLAGLAPCTIDASLQLATRTGHLHAAWEGALTQLDRLAAMGGIRQLDILGGAATADVDVDFDLGQDDPYDQVRQLTGSVSGRNWDLVWSGFHLQDGAFSIDLAGWPLVQSSTPATLAWHEIDVGVPVTDIAMHFDAKLDPRKERYEISGHDFSASSVGGKLSSIDYALDVMRLNGHMNLRADGIQLNQLLALHEEEFETTGSISGSVPVQIRGGNVIVEKGKVSASQPGGLIRYKPSDTVKSMVASNEEMKKVVDALSDFHYNALDSEFDYDADGNLTANTSLKGSNPQYENGREIHFNLNLEENVGALLESLRLSDEVSRQVERRIRHEESVKRGAQP